MNFLFGETHSGLTLILHSLQQMRCRRRIVRSSLIWSVELSKELILEFADKIIAFKGKGFPWVKGHHYYCTFFTTYVSL